MPALRLLHPQTSPSAEPWISAPAERTATPDKGTRSRKIGDATGPAGGLASACTHCTTFWKDDPHDHPALPAEKVEIIRDLITSNTFGAGVLETDDVQKEYEELSAKGVEFVRPPEEQFYGIEALFRDDSGNWFSLTQRTTN